ncbi:MAG TPA: DUF72 domain-containing protein [Noviherbaspirillum sp.]
MENDIPAVQIAAAPVYIGCAGWNLPAAVHARFPVAGTHLQRYAAVFPAVEINSSFYRPHRPATYARWRDTVPENFRFAAKIPKAITHDMRLRNPGPALEKFLAEVGGLGHKLGCLLVQLPPRLRYEESAAQAFFRILCGLTDASIVCEPRHPSWFGDEAAALLAQREVAYVHADPSIAPVPECADARVEYLRLHGSPEVYHSAYNDTYLDCLAAEIAWKAHGGRQVWCIFDNTASGAAVPNALSLLGRLQGTVAAAA